MNIDSIIITPKEPKKVKDLKINDLIIGRDSEIYRIKDIKSLGIKRVYEVFLSDNTKLDCHLEQLFRVNVHDKDNEFINTTIMKLSAIKNSMLDSYFKLNLPYNINFIENNNLLLSPYCMGVMVARNGNLNSIKTTNQEVFNYIYEELGLYKIRDKYQSTKLTEKHSFKLIPDNYLYNSKNIRFNVLRGLMDILGFIENNKYAIKIKNEQLFNQVLDLLKSLGARLKVYINKSIFYIYFNFDKNIGRPFRYKNYPQLFYPVEYLIKFFYSIEETDRYSEFFDIVVDSHDRMLLTNGYTPIISFDRNRL